MKEYTILIVDDEPDISDLLEKALHMEGYRHILKAGDGPLSVSLCRQASPDAIILDIML